MKTYYEVLGIDKDADAKEIRKAFRELAKRFHPDVAKNNPKNNAKIFEEITLAYSILSNKEKRKSYDESLKRNEKANFIGNFKFKEFFNFKIVEKFFSKKADSYSNSKELEKLSIQELIDRIIYSKNIYVQKYAVKIILEKKRLYVIKDLLKILYLNINDEIKLYIITEIKKRRLSKRIKEIFKEIYNYEKSESIRKELYYCFE